MNTLANIRIMLLTSAAAITIRKVVMQNHETDQEEIVKIYSISR